MARNTFIGNNYRGRACKLERKKGLVKLVLSFITLYAFSHLLAQLKVHVTADFSNLASFIV